MQPKNPEPSKMCLEGCALTKTNACIQVASGWHSLRTRWWWTLVAKSGVKLLLGLYGRVVRNPSSKASSGPTACRISKEPSTRRSRSGRAPLIIITRDCIMWPRGDQITARLGYWERCSSCWSMPATKFSIWNNYRESPSWVRLWNTCTCPPKFTTLSSAAFESLHKRFPRGACTAMINTYTHIYVYMYI